jgi:cysteinyl-tRNA synthetase
MLVSRSVALRIFNTLTGEKEPFAPLRPPKVGLYVCGVTSYDFSHIGHARCYVAFDVAARVLRARGFEVTYVRNFTDIDDKIIQRANELGESPAVLSSRFIEAYREDMQALGVLPADIEPRVTAHIPEIVAMIGKLVDRGLAYASQGDVYFSVRAFPDYGRLSRRKLDDLKAGARVEPGEQKRDPLDFALWKAAKPGEPFWESPWGAGRPGWHIECSAMSERYLGETFDLHAGGKDLVFPHHENEIAQSEGASGKLFARGWMHNGFVTVDEEKMSKSLGNFFTIREVIAKFEPEALRLFLLGTHYRSPISFSDAGVAEAERRLDYFYETLLKADEAGGSEPPASRAQGPGTTAIRAQGPGTTASPASGGDFQTTLDAALDDDFNTPEALAALSAPFTKLNELLAKPSKTRLPEIAALAAALREATRVLGICQEAPPTYLARRYARVMKERALDGARVQALIDRRTAARAAKDFAAADGIRQELLGLGVEVKDTPAGTVWKPLLSGR